MGRTLLGVDLDESHAGGLVKRLLTDEELEKLADGGRPADDDRDGPDAGADGGDANAGPDTDDDGDGDASDDTDDEASGVDTDTDAGSGSGTGSRSGETDGSSVGVDSATGSVGGRDWTGTDDSDWLDDGDDGDEGRLGGYGPLVLKGGAVVLVLVVVALVVWRYGGRVKEAVPFVGGSGTSEERDVEDDESAAAGVDEDVSPARRRAKVGERDDGDDAGSETGSGRSRVDDGGEGRGRGEPGVEAVGRDVDLGALVGLGTLALIAALVRKFGEQRPRDPLVDGPDDAE